MTRVLIAIDGSEPSLNALEFAFDRYADTDLVVVSVLDPTEYLQGSSTMGPASVDSWQEAADDAAGEVLDAAVERARAHGLELETDTVYGSPAREIVDYAEEHDIDQIIVGSHGREGVSRILLGSVAETVVRRASVPVTVVR
jgi:nucleotide-binding universal stress UspA family protein